MVTFGTVGTGTVFIKTRKNMKDVTVLDQFDFTGVGDPNF